MKKKRKALKFLIALLLVIIIASLGVYSYHRYTHPLKYTEYIEKYSAEYNVPKDLLYATIKVESGFNEKAESNVGAKGLTQIMPDTLAWLVSKTGENYTEDDLENPEIAIKYCAYLYSILLNRFEDRDAAIAAYHAGMGSVSGWLNNPEYSKDGVHLDKIPSKVTAHYVNKVTKSIDIYQNLYKKEFLK